MRCALAVAALFLVAGCGGGTRHVYGTRAGDLDAGSILSASFPLRRGASYMIGLDVLKNVGSGPIRVESVHPLSTSPSLRLTRGRLWIIPHNAHLTLPNGWPGWPPRDPPTKPPKSNPNWVQPHPNVLSLPTSRAIPAGREAQLVYGIFLHAEASPRIRITALRIRFEQSGHAYVWTLPEPVHPLRPH